MAKRVAEAPLANDVTKKSNTRGPRLALAYTPTKRFIDAVRAAVLLPRYDPTESVTLSSQPLILHYETHEECTTYALAYWPSAQSIGEAGC